jgi:hypothetical protein
METTPLAQRLYDKASADASSFRDEIAQWQMKQANSGFVYSGSATDAFWQNCQDHLRGRIASYFEWIEIEARKSSPSTSRRDAIEQCVGAVITYASNVRRVAVEKHRVMAKLDGPVDLGRWDDIDAQAINSRGANLIAALGLGRDAKRTERLNHLVKDHPWFFNLLSVLSFAMSVLALWRSFGAKD